MRMLVGGVSDMTIRRWNAAGLFPDAIVIGARRYWRGSDYLRWLETAPRKRAVAADAA
jgi:predicted DNA-binding transcriptional regulator AlpA